MNKEHDICAECIEFANRVHDIVNCKYCPCKECPLIHNCHGECYK